MTAAAARLEIMGASLVLHGAYRAATAVRAGDALRIVSDWLVTQTSSGTDNVIGFAKDSAAPGEDVSVVIAGLARTVCIVPVSPGEPLAPCPDVPGKAHRASDAIGLGIQQARKHGVAAEAKPAGKPAWVQVRTLGQ